MCEDELVDGAAEEDDFDGKAENGGGRLSLWELVVVAGFSPLEPVGGGRLGVKPAPRKVGATFGGMMDLEGVGGAGARNELQGTTVPKCYPTKHSTQIDSEHAYPLC